MELRLYKRLSKTWQSPLGDPRNPVPHTWYHGRLCGIPRTREGSLKWESEGTERYLRSQLGTGDFRSGIITGDPLTNNFSTFWNEKFLFVYWKFNGTNCREPFGHGPESTLSAKPGAAAPGKTHSRRGELFRTNHFFSTFWQVSDETKPHITFQS